MRSLHHHGRLKDVDLSGPTRTAVLAPTDAGLADDTVVDGVPLLIGVQWGPRFRGDRLQSGPRDGGSTLASRFEKPRLGCRLWKRSEDSTSVFYGLQVDQGDLPRAETVAEGRPEIIRSGETPFSYERTVQPRPKLGPWTAVLEELLETNAAKPAREQLTLIRIFEELRGHVRDLAKDWENLNRNALAFLKLASIRLMVRKLCNP